LLESGRALCYTEFGALPKTGRPSRHISQLSTVKERR
jgi:hypothetical protein